jgi:RimJ/RimL family protein N-acetyltransferase
MSQSSYRIGIPGNSWGDKEKIEWRTDVGMSKRSYQQDVVSKIEALKDHLHVVQYGSLSVDPKRYPLFCIKTRGCWDDPLKHCLLITGGVHGNETSSVEGALLFATTEMKLLGDAGFNVCVCPCINPWGYEHLQRWSWTSLDPNRGFFPTSALCPTEEAGNFIALLASLGGASRWSMHIDLRETSLVDGIEFRPAKAARDGMKRYKTFSVDGFYLIGDEKQSDCVRHWQKSILDEVQQIASIDTNTKGGLFMMPTRSLFSCSSVTNAQFSTTTKVYNSNPVAGSDESKECSRVQVEAIKAGLHLIEKQFYRKVESFRAVFPKTDLDCRQVWEWRNDAKTRAASRTTKKIPYDAHVRWFHDIQMTKPWSLLICVWNDTNIGVVRFSDIIVLGKRNCFEIGINLNPKFRGRRLSPRCIRCSIEAFRELRDIEVDYVIAEIKVGNIPSLKAFTRAGFVPNGCVSSSMVQLIYYCK